MNETNKPDVDAPLTEDERVVLLPKYRPASYCPDGTGAFRERPITPTVIAAANPDLVGPKIRANGVVIGGISLADIARNCNISRSTANNIFSGRYRTSKNTQLVIATYLQITVDELDEIIARRKRDRLRLQADLKRHYKEDKPGLVGID